MSFASWLHFYLVFNFDAGPRACVHGNSYRYDFQAMNCLESKTYPQSQDYHHQPQLHYITLSDSSSVFIDAVDFFAWLYFV